MRVRIIPLVVLLALAMSCGSGNGALTSSAVSGAYEFVVTSNVTGGVTLVEANMAANGNQSSASGPSQVQILTLEHKNWYVNGVCTGATPGQNSVAASVSGNNIALTFNQGGSALPGRGVLNGTTVTGNYSISGSNCAALNGPPTTVPPIYPPGVDSGGIVGNQVPALVGIYSGPLTLLSGTDNATLTLSEDVNHELTVSTALAGPIDNGTFSFTGSAVGNIMFVSGSVNGQALSWFGYFDRAGTYTGMPNSILLFDYSTYNEIGLLVRE